MRRVLSGISSTSIFFKMVVFYGVSVTSKYDFYCKLILSWIYDSDIAFVP